MPVDSSETRAARNVVVERTRLGRSRRTNGGRVHCCSVALPCHSDDGARAARNVSRDRWLQPHSAAPPPPSGGRGGAQTARYLVVSSARNARGTLTVAAQCDPLILLPAAARKRRASSTPRARLAQLRPARQGSHAATRDAALIQQGVAEAKCTLYSICPSRSTATRSGGTHTAVALCGPPSG